MNFSEYFIKYDARRDKTTIRPMGIVLILLVLVLLLGAVFGMWKALTNKVQAVDTATLSTATPSDAAEIGGVWQPRDTGQDPINWHVIKVEDMGNGIIRYALPPEIKKLAIDEIQELIDWQTKYISAADAEALAQHVDTYYAEPLLTTMKKYIDTLERSGQVGVEFDKQPPPYNLPPLEIEGVTQDGKTAYIRQTIGARKMDFFNADGSRIEGMSTASYPPQQYVYRIVFNTELRRWQLAEQLEGPITLPEPPVQNGVAQ